MLNRLQRNFAHVTTTVTLSWRVQNFVVIGKLHFKLEHCKIWSDFEFDRNIVSGTGAWDDNAFRITGALLGRIQRSPVDFPFEVFLVAGLNKLLNKHSSCLWFETTWRLCDVAVLLSAVGYNRWTKMMEDPNNVSWIMWKHLYVISQFRVYLTF